jgi:hypothetical protein
MRVLRRTTVISAALFLAVLPLASQDHTTAAGYGLGLINPGRLNPGVGQLPLKMDEGWALTAFGETWHAAEGRMGLRLAAAFTQRPLSIGGELRDVNTWFADASVILRLLPPTAGRAVAPFVSVGGGLAQYGLGTGPPLIYQEEGVVYPGEQRLQGTAVVGAGLEASASPVLRWACAWTSPTMCSCDHRSGGWRATRGSDRSTTCGSVSR